MVILWDKIPLSNALAMSLQTAQRGGKFCRPAALLFLSYARSNKREARFLGKQNEKWMFEVDEMKNKVWIKLIKVTAPSKATVRDRGEQN